MSLNLMDQFKDLLTDAAMNKISGALGGADTGTLLKGLTGAGGSLLAGAMSKASTEEGAKGLFDMLGDGAGLDSFADNLSPNSGFMSMGNNLARGILGDKAGAVLDMIGKDTGLDADKSSSLLNIGSGLIGGLLGKQKALGGGVGSLVSLLASQGSIVEKLLPNVGSLLGLGSLASMAGKLSGISNLLGDGVGAVAGLASNAGNAAADIATGAAGKVGEGISATAGAASDIGHAAAREGGSLLGKLIPVALIAGLGLLGWNWLNGKNAMDKVEDAAHTTVNGAATVVNDVSDATSTAVNTVSDAASDATGKVKSALNAFGDKVGNLFSFKLPGGSALNIPKNGFEEQFLTALGQNGTQGNYYVFDRLFFASGSANLNEQSSEQIANAAAILKAYPDITVRLRGHTDSTGSADANQALSEARANSVKSAIVASGVSADRIVTEGVASAHPIADNATAQGRIRNRRIDISVMK